MAKEMKGEAKRGKGNEQKSLTEQSYAKQWKRTEKFSADEQRKSRVAKCFAMELYRIEQWRSGIEEYGVA